jgi:hypothetical protein
MPVKILKASIQAGVSCCHYIRQEREQGLYLGPIPRIGDGDIRCDSTGGPFGRIAGRHPEVFLSLRKTKRALFNSEMISFRKTMNYIVNTKAIFQIYAAIIFNQLSFFQNAQMIKYNYKKVITSYSKREALRKFIKA